MKDWFKGKGAQYNPANKFLSNYLSLEEDYMDEPLLDEAPKTKVFFESPKKAVSKNDSPDLKMILSINPYQGCEHGCIYCFARPTHEYWGMGAGLDFESKIIVKKDLPSVLQKELMNPRWKVSPIMISGNTDCYQPLEKKHRITREVLKVLLDFRHPVSILTKNALVTRDIDVLTELSGHNLVHVGFSITTLDESLRRRLEPRTASTKSKFKAIETLTKLGIPVMVMTAPIIPGLNDHEVPMILKRSAEAGALSASYTIVRLNGKIGELTRDWLLKQFPDRAEKIWSQVESLHGGQVSDSQWGRRLRGEGVLASTIKNLFEVSFKKYFGSKSGELKPLRTDLFRRTGSYNLFNPS